MGGECVYASVCRREKREMEREMEIDGEGEGERQKENTLQLCPESFW